MKRICILLLLFVSLATAADKKIVLRAAGGGWAATESAIAGYRKAAGDRADVVVARTQEDLTREIVDADAVIGGVSVEQFAKATKLKWLQTTSAGVEAYSFWPEFVASNVALTNCKVVQGPTIGDHAFALLLALTRGLHEYIPNRTGARAWERRANAPSMTELADMTALIIGVGGIGTQIAQRAHGFGMEVIGVDPKDLPVSMFVPKIVPPDRLDEVLPEADVVFVSAPLTPKSEGMIAAKEFDLMKRGAYFIVVSRGRLYDKQALVKALDSQKLAGAGLDVTDPEPLPTDDALWEFDNVVITPHIASVSHASNMRRLGVITGNIERFAHGQPLTHVVDKSKGY